MLALHIVAGLIALLSGAVALYARKGGKVHRKGGMVFAYAMLAMSAVAVALAILEPVLSSAIVAGLTIYLVLTSLLAVRRPTPGKRWPDVAAMLFGLAVGGCGYALGIAAVNGGTGTEDGESAAAFFVFGSVAVFAALLDMRMLLAGGIKTSHHRLARHLWRMCFALFLATSALFLGQPEVFPEPMRDFRLLSIPVLSVFLLMCFWLGRVLLLKRYRRSIPVP